MRAEKCPAGEAGHDGCGLRLVPSLRPQNRRPPEPMQAATLLSWLLFSALGNELPNPEDARAMVREGLENALRLAN